MNIKEAKKQIYGAAKAYLQRDEAGRLKIPAERQRPLFLLGAPGLGKTAVMEQAARELDICLVSYSMTHHTRQSALGLPYIVKKSYGGREYSVSEYTMSEIIASVYEAMEKSGKNEGILFLDEINCVSETLAPSMLQFLQYKTFGRHAMPEGWVIASAGNPPEYNLSVREFDAATLDRLKLIEIKPDYPVWREYAMEKSIHSCIISFLDMRRDAFYCVDTDIESRSIVTARGWEDLSEMLLLYEHLKLDIDENLIVQYIQNLRLAREFSAYYNVYLAYSRGEMIHDILNGDSGEKTLAAAKQASFEERSIICLLLLERLRGLASNCRTEESIADTKAAIENMLGFINLAFGDGDELFTAVNDLTACPETAEFLSSYGSEAYGRLYDAMLFSSMERTLKAEGTK